MADGHYSEAGWIERASLDELVSTFDDLRAGRGRRCSSTSASPADRQVVQIESPLAGGTGRGAGPAATRAS